MSVTRINKFEAVEGRAADLHAFLKSIVPSIERAEGCKSCQVLRNLDNANEFVVIEVWTSVSAHQVSTKDIPPEQIALVMPMLANPPAGTYYSA